ncbi:hypothetical protein BKA66DRAFT_448579 [Pyrenochaeta sp. MPI-SDFR-AT-0127]|nr:hypothetical protein BKA66DRAFT_448579 [Pyrenochaeta sp. MPI-SDFR-AT-0127]
MTGYAAHYFNNNKKDKIKAILQTLIGAQDENDPGNTNPGGGSNIFQYVTFRNRNQGEGEQCEENPESTLSFLLNLESDEPSNLPGDDDFGAIIRICDLGYKFPAFRETRCESLEKVSPIMRDSFWKALRVTENTQDLWGQQSYGPLAARDIKDSLSDESNNAEGYRWFAQEVWWSHVCNKDYEKATSNDDYIRCHDKSGNTAACEMPKIGKPDPSRHVEKTLTIMQNARVDGANGPVMNANSLLFFETNKGESPICHKETTAMWRIFSESRNANIDNQPLPGGTYPPESDPPFRMKDTDCRYKNDGTDAGAVWCNEKPFTCHDVRAQQITENCGGGPIIYRQHPVVYCEF